MALFIAAPHNCLPKHFRMRFHNVIRQTIKSTVRFVSWLRVVLKGLLEYFLGLTGGSLTELMTGLDTGGITRMLPLL